MIKFHYSTRAFNSGGGGGWQMSTYLDEVATQDSFGFYVTTTEIPSNSGENLFPNLFDYENFNEVTYYKNFFLYYDSTGMYSGATGIKIWIENLPSGVDFDIGFDPIDPTPKDYLGNQATGTSNYGIPPSGVTYSVPTSSTPLTLTSLNEGYVKSLWLRMQANAIPSQELDKGDWVDVFVEYENF